MKNVKPGHSCPVVCLDAGHYADYNRCPIIPEYYESRMNWKLHLLLKKELESYGMKVITTRDDPEKDLGLQARGRKGKDADLVLSLHSNAVGSSAGENGMNENVDYVVAYVPIDGSVNALGEALAAAVAEQMETAQKPRAISRKGSGEWDYYSVIYGAVSVGTPGIILEHSFHTNSRATRWLLQEENLQKLAKAEAKVLAEYFGVEKLPFTDVPENAYYADALRWAYARGITLGKDATHFHPNAPITRAEAVAMLHRSQLTMDN